MRRGRLRNQTSDGPDAGRMRAPYWADNPLRVLRSAHARRKAFGDVGLMFFRVAYPAFSRAAKNGPPGWPAGHRASSGPRPGSSRIRGLSIRPQDWPSKSARNGPPRWPAGHQALSGPRHRLLCCKYATQIPYPMIASSRRKRRGVRRPVNPSAPIPLLEPATGERLDGERYKSSWRRAYAQ